MPIRLFRDRAVNWHAQQFGKDGLIAAAGLFVEGRVGYVTLLQSDLCQQIYRDAELKRECASRLNNRFRYWHKILLNAVLDFALDLGLDTIYSPTAAHILATTPKDIAPELFIQIYDSVPTSYQCERCTVGDAEYWRVELQNNRDRVALLNSKSSEIALPNRVICVYHDIECDVDTAVSKDDCIRALGRMLEIERSRSLSTTYNVLGTIYKEVAPSIMDAGTHTIGLHSYDHNVGDVNQLPRSREVDLQVKGYRPAQSVITPEITEYNLSYYNFEWLLGWWKHFESIEPIVDRGIVKIPVHQDDYSLTRDEKYEDWTEQLFRTVDQQRFVAVGLHDCYSKFWLHEYGDLLDRLLSAGEIWSGDQVVNHVYLANAL